jgi:hypothetical protein
VARLEDVQPDGTVSLVTGAHLNGSQRDSRLDPKALSPGEVYDIEFEMHFTTWTFKSGHRIRLAVSNALFPIMWPSPYPMTTRLFIGQENTRLELPVIPAIKRPVPAFIPPEPREESSIRIISGEPPPPASVPGPYLWPGTSVEQKRDLNSTVSVDWKGARSLEVQGGRFRGFIRDYYDTNDKNPALSSYHGERGRWIEIGGRIVDLRSTVDIHSDESHFTVVFSRQIFENGRPIRRREWRETIKRDFQ